MMTLILELFIHTFQDDDNYELWKEIALTCKHLSFFLEEKRLIVCYRRGMRSIHKKLNEHLENLDWLKEGIFCLQMCTYYVFIIGKLINIPAFTKTFEITNDGKQYRKSWKYMKCNSYTSETLLALHGRMEKKSWFKFEWIEGTSHYWVEVI